MSSEKEKIQTAEQSSEGVLEVLQPDPVEMPPMLMRAADDNWVRGLEKMAANAQRVIAAHNKIIATIAQPNDWVTHDGKSASLCSAGAERFLRYFAIQFTGWEREKIEWTDGAGPAYRWTYRCFASYEGSTLLVEGKFSTRDKLLGFKGDAWRPLEEIDESDITQAARRTCIAEGVKQLLGIRHFSIETLRTLGVNVENIKSLSYEKGKGGGAPETTANDVVLQRRLTIMARELAGGNVNEAGSIVETASSFATKDGKTIAGKKNPQYLTGKRLEITYGKIMDRFIAEFGDEEYAAKIDPGPQAKATAESQTDGGADEVPR
jgi:hypothetical protein